MPKVKCNDIDIYYEVHGKGFPLVMIRGLGGNVYQWDPQLIREMSKRFKAVIFDNRGAGRTDAPKIDYSPKMFADDTVRLMDNLKIEKAHILGISMGGNIAQDIALAYPQRVEKLILCNTDCGESKSVSPTPEVLDRWRRWAESWGVASPEEMAKSGIQFIMTEDFIKNNPDYVKHAIERIAKTPPTRDGRTRTIKAYEGWDTYARLPEIRAPTLVIQGKKDILNPPENAKIIADRIPRAKLVYLEKSAHFLSEEVNKLVNTLVEFLA